MLNVIILRSVRHLSISDVRISKILSFCSLYGFTVAVGIFTSLTRGYLVFTCELNLSIPSWSVIIDSGAMIVIGILFVYGCPSAFRPTLGKHQK